jgi:hypothetical protein
VWGDREYSHDFDILDLSSGTDVIIGYDLFNKLGLGITGLPLPQPTLPSSAPLDDQPDSLVDIHEQQSRHELEDDPALIEAVRANQLIASNAFCSLPEAVVHLNTGDASPISRRQYDIPFKIAPLVSQQINEWLAKGKIVPAPHQCAWNQPILAVPQKDLQGQKTKIRVGLDPRPLNKILPDDRFPLPLIRDIFDNISGMQYFSTLDLEESYFSYLCTPMIVSRQRLLGIVSS